MHFKKVKWSVCRYCVCRSKIWYPKWKFYNLQMIIEKQWLLEDSSLLLRRVNVDNTQYRDIFIKSPRGGIWDFGPFLKQIVDLFLRCVAQRFSFFFKKYKILDLFLKGVVWTSRYLTKHPKLWTFLVSHWVRGPDILQKFQICGPFSLAHGSEVHDIPQSIQNCGPFFPTRGSEV